MQLKAIEKTLANKNFSFNLQTIIFIIILFSLAFLVLYPLVLLIMGSFIAGVPRDEGLVLTLQNWVLALQEPGILSAFRNTIYLTFIYTSISIPLAIFISWLLARTNLPGSHWFEFGFWVSFFLPTLSVIQGWILLLDPSYGLLNNWIMNWLPVDAPIFNIYSWWGIVFGHLVTNAIAVKVMLMTPAFRNMDSSMEEASQMVGDSKLATLRKITIPVMIPTILVTSIMAIIRALESFEIELILGAPQRIDVYSTLIYRLMRQETAAYGVSSALGVMIIVFMLIFVFFQWWFIRKRKYTTVSGKYQMHKIDLGRWKWVCFSGLVVLLLLLTIVPIVFLLIGTFMSVYGFFGLEKTWTISHWSSVLTDRVFTQSLWNTLKLSVGTALFTVTFSFIIAYISVRTKFFGRTALDLLSWVPFTMPGILFSLAMLWFILGNPILQPLYGGTFILILVIGLSMLTLGTQIIKSNLMQIGSELEEASWISRASWWTTLHKVILPLSIQSIVVVAIMGFIAAGRNISHLALLVSSDNRPLAIMQLEYMAEGRYEAASVAGFVIVILTIVVALFARVYGFRIGPRN